jgi:hypothetical protein
MPKYSPQHLANKNMKNRMALAIAYYCLLMFTF